MEVEFGECFMSRALSAQTVRITMDPQVQSGGFPGYHVRAGGVVFANGFENLSKDTA